MMPVEVELKVGTGELRGQVKAEFLDLNLCTRKWRWHDRDLQSHVFSRLLDASSWWLDLRTTSGRDTAETERPSGSLEAILGYQCARRRVTEP